MCSLIVSSKWNELPWDAKILSWVPIDSKFGVGDDDAASDHFS